MPRHCIQCGKRLEPDSSSSERWCPIGCFREWYLARNPGYELITQKLRLANPLDGQTVLAEEDR